MTDAGSPCPFGNVAHLARPLEAGEAERLVDTMRAFYGGAAGGTFILFSVHPTPDLARARPRARRAPADDDPPRRSRAAGGQRQRTCASKSWATASSSRISNARWSRPTRLSSWPRSVRSHGCSASRCSTPGWTLYVGYEGDRPVATSAAFVTDHVVAVEMVSTRSECRGSRVRRGDHGRRRHDSHRPPVGAGVERPRQRRLPRGSATCRSCATRCGWVER